MTDYEAIRSPNRTDDEWAMDTLFPLCEWEWFDGSEATC